MCGGSEGGGEEKRLWEPHHLRLIFSRPQDTNTGLPCLTPAPTHVDLSCSEPCLPAYCTPDHRQGRKKRSSNGRQESLKPLSRLLRPGVRISGTTKCTEVRLPGEGQEVTGVVQVLAKPRHTRFMTVMRVLHLKSCSLKCNLGNGASDPWIVELL